MTVRKRGITTAVLAILFLCIGAFLAVKFLTPPKLYISEICPTNSGEYEVASKVTDLNGEYCDWIEIYNPTDKDISLADVTICKDNEEVSIGKYRLASKCYLLVYCSANGFSDSIDVPHAEFSIGKAEENTYSLKYGFSIVDSVKTCVIDKGNSYSRDENANMYVSSPTPDADNSSLTIGSTPVFSKESGMYNESFDLEITAGEGQTIYYTMDGTDPETSETRIEYTGAFNVYDKSGESNTLSAYDTSKIQTDYRPGKIDVPDISAVDKGTVIRACAKGSDNSYGRTVTATYFIGVSNADYSDMPIISVVTDPENLYNETTGIYCLGDVYAEYYAQHPDHYYNGSIPANYNQSGREWERSCYIEYFDSEGNLQISQDAGMRIQGGWSRAEYQKSFRFFARSSYGKNSFDYAFWDGLTSQDGTDTTLDSFSTFVLRNGGNDTNYSKFKDTMIQNLVSKNNVETQSGTPCVLFIDGEYWGVYTLQEDYSQEHFAQTYGVNESDVAIYKNGELDEGTQEDETDFLELRNFIVDNDMSDNKNYQEVCKQLDIDNFASYVALQLYIYNNDWPQNNYGCWRTSRVMTGNEYSDGRWRFFIFDTESSMNHYNTTLDEITTIENWRKNSTSILGGMVLGMLDNKEFCEKVCTAVMDYGNISFEYRHFNTVLDDYLDVYYEEILKYFERFPTWANADNTTNPMIERMKDFIYKRKDEVMELMEREFDLSEERKIEVTSSDFNGGYVLLNNSPITQKFKGIYYDNCEITLTAKAYDGWVLVGWDGYDSDEETITVKVKGNETITAKYERSLL